MCFLNVMSNGDLNRALLIRSNHTIADITLELKIC